MIIVHIYSCFAGYLSFVIKKNHLSRWDVKCIKIVKVFYLELDIAMLEDYCDTNNGMGLDILYLFNVYPSPTWPIKDTSVQYT